MKFILPAIAIICLAGAVVFHAQTGRYEIMSAGAGVYRVDTRTGELAVCSPVQKHGCTDLTEVYRRIVQQKKNALTKAAQAQNKVNEFTKKRADDLKNIMKKFESPAKSDASGAKQ